MAASWITFASANCSAIGRFLDSLHFEKSQISDRFSRSVEESVMRDTLTLMRRSLFVITMVASCAPNARKGIQEVNYPDGKKNYL
jgi:hypothetical protein